MMESKIKCYLPICSLTAIPKAHMMEFTVNRRTVQLNKQIMTPALDGGPLQILSANRKNNTICCDGIMLHQTALANKPAHRSVLHTNKTDQAKTKAAALTKNTT